MTTIHKSQIHTITFGKSVAQLRADANAILSAALGAADARKAVRRHLSVSSNGDVLNVGTGVRLRLARFDRVFVVGAGKSWCSHGDCCGGRSSVMQALERTCECEIRSSVPRPRHISLNECGHPLLRNFWNNPICSIIHEEANHCIVVVWKQYATQIQLRYIHENLLTLICKHRVYKILGDDTAVPAIPSEDRFWIIDEWFPRTMKCGLRFAASKTPASYFGKLAVSQIQLGAPAGIECRSFEQLHEARNWLQDRDGRVDRPEQTSCPNCCSGAKSNQLIGHMAVTVVTQIIGSYRKGIRHIEPIG
jgi:hypothetical protein